MCIVLLIIAAVIAGFIYSLSKSSDMQMWIMHHGMEKLSEKLQTRVSADSIGVDIEKGRIFVYGFEMDDRRKVRMLRVDTLEARMQMEELVNKRVVINNIMLYGINANLYKEKRDSAANYQFVIDTFKKDKKKKKKKGDGDKIYVELDAADLHRLQVRWNDDDFALASMKYNGKNQNVKLNGVTAKTDNKKPRKNVKKPRRGAFDTGHLNSIANIDITLGDVKKDSLGFTINHLDAKDWKNGFDIKNLTAKVDVKGDDVTITGLHIDFGKATHVVFDKLKATYVVIPGNKKKGTKKKVDFNIFPSLMTAKVDLRDISKAFAPSLSQFSTPLRLKVIVSGNPNRIMFKDIRVSSNDNRLQLKANGDLCNIREKEKLCLHFNNIHLNARNGIKEQIVNHFAKKMKLKMMKQMQVIGDVAFDGSLGIFRKKEKIKGCLQTKFGNVDVDFIIDGNTKRMTGSMSSDSLEIGKVMDMKKLGYIKASATYSFDIATNKKTTTKGRHQGRLPIGWLNAEVDNARYMIIHFKKIKVKMKSDGTTANGVLHVPQKLFDIVTRFSYTQTDSLHKMKVKPKITRHHKDDEEVELDL